jgi:hypothetical protein
MAQMSSKFGEIIKKPEAVGEMSQTKLHPKRPPPLPAKSDGEYFSGVFHVVMPDPPKLSAVLTRHSGWQKPGERAG